MGGGGWLDIAILMKTKSSAFDFAFKLGLLVWQLKLIASEKWKKISFKDSKPTTDQLKFDSAGKFEKDVTVTQKYLW